MEKLNDNVVCRTHRVGSITAGLSMISFGILFLMHTLLDKLDYQMIFSFWPVMLIGMGIELLLSTSRKFRVVYDKAAIFLLVLMTFFAMGLSCVDVCMEAVAAGVWAV